MAESKKKKLNSKWDNEYNPDETITITIPKRLAKQFDKAVIEECGGENGIVLEYMKQNKIPEEDLDKVLDWSLDDVLSHDNDPQRLGVQRYCLLEVLSKVNDIVQEALDER